MEHVRELIQYLVADGDRFAFFAIAALSAFEIFVRVSPTKSPKSGLERIGSVIKFILDYLKVPNTKRKEGSIKPDGQHEKICKVIEPS